MPENKRHHLAPGSFETRYPNVAAWVRIGFIEIGHNDYSRSFVRALDIGGMIWEGAEEYDSLDDAFRALDEGIAAAREEMGI